MTDIKDDSTTVETESCPCSSGLCYDSCCKPYHKGIKHAPSAEALMRARYSAYALGEMDYLLKSIPLIERKRFDIRDARAWSSQSEWLGLEVISTKESSNGQKATVEFKAKFKAGENEHTHHERAYFEKTAGRWFFLDGKILEAKE
ncbi:MAG TPA: YchJ family metal-binding protein [Oligoflexia bacterium]|nr:YchJ family metal-binding protein [Oligoflexia bacterium]HMP47598.1 YchJ family metal-binding protein [Oligoflexia bacterium]